MVTRTQRATEVGMSSGRRRARKVSAPGGLELQAVEEVTDDGCGADFEGFEEVPGQRGGHRCSAPGMSGVRAVMVAGVQGGKADEGEQKKTSLAAAARASLVALA